MYNFLKKINFDKDLVVKISCCELVCKVIVNKSLLIVFGVCVNVWNFNYLLRLLILINLDGRGCGINLKLLNILIKEIMFLFW